MFDRLRLCVSEPTLPFRRIDGRLNASRMLVTVADFGIELSVAGKRTVDEEKNAWRLRPEDALLDDLYKKAPSIYGI